MPRSVPERARTAWKLPSELCPELLRDGGYEYGSSGYRFDDHDAAVAVDRFIGPGREGLGAPAHGQQHLTRTAGRDGNRDPTDLAEKALVRAHVTGFLMLGVPPARTRCVPWYITVLGTPTATLGYLFGAGSGWLEAGRNSGFAPGWSGWQARHGVQPACLASPSVIRFRSSSPMKRMRMHCAL